ncbi:hypothetical protein CkaCkLH20_01989 [Colletotrichum karsti]|uniref:Uncharacterized protein n=1 Tax=Colletotrichum karsti TaxID=1095194 RepID=A0A9P6ICM4_9PEZI|nr:uncharacterized protein CkaCkLH20_01989 [Colletotrichum karsti]KAF9880947.1 hypothetical protein CkaCkLH20_01989 [Colletotrichum karsti]
MPNNVDNLFCVWRIVNHRRNAASLRHECGELNVQSVGHGEDESVQGKAIADFLDGIPGSISNNHQVSHNSTRMVRTRKKAGRKPKAEASNRGTIVKQQLRRRYQHDTSSVLLVGESPWKSNGPGLRYNRVSEQIEYVAMTAAMIFQADEIRLVDQLDDMRLSPQSAMAEQSIRVGIPGRELRRQTARSAEERQQATKLRRSVKVAEKAIMKQLIQLERAKGCITGVEGQSCSVESSRVRGSRQTSR